MSVVTTGSRRYTAVPHVAACGPTTISSIASTNSGGIDGAQAETQRDAVVVDQVDGAFDAGTLRLVKPRDAREHVAQLDAGGDRLEDSSLPLRAVFGALPLGDVADDDREARAAVDLRARDAEVDREGRSVATPARGVALGREKHRLSRAAERLVRATRKLGGGRRRNQLEDGPSNRVGRRVSEHRFRRAVDHGDRVASRRR